MIKATLKRMAITIWKACGSPLFLTRGDTVILAYHRVFEGDTPQRASSIAISRSNFSNQLAGLKKHFVLVQLDELLAMSANERKAGGPYCALTFDDGWHDNYAVALPILKQFNAPATIFICTSYVDTYRRYWWEALEECLQAYSKLSASKQAEVRDALIAVLEDTPEETRITKESLIPWCKKHKAAEIEKFVGAFASKLNITTQKQSSLSSAEIREMQKNGCSFGSHTANHAILPVETEDVARNELAESLEYLRAITGKKDILFAYPNGDHSPRDVALVAETGFWASVTVRPGILSAHITNLHELPRIDSCGKDSADSLLFSIFRCSIRGCVAKIYSKYLQ